MDLISMETIRPLRRQFRTILVSSSSTVHYPRVSHNSVDSFVPTFQSRSRMQREQNELTEDELMLTPPIVYGFSLSDKAWRE